MNELPIFVIPDIHGNLEALQYLLEAQGIITKGTGIRIPDKCITVQLGDLANCVGDPAPGEDDLGCLSKVGSWIDEYLVGNHEYGYLREDQRGQFWGFQFDEAVSQKMLQLAPDPCYNAYGWLLTHAGLSRSMSEHYDLCFEEGDDVEVLAAVIGDIWDADNTHELFSQVGNQRGGFHEEGGILWSDDCERKAKIKQVYGHTPGNEIRTNHSDLNLCTQYCIDLGVDKNRHAVKGIAYAWIYPDGSIETGIEYPGMPVS